MTATHTGGTGADAGAGPGPVSFRLDGRTALVTGSARGLGPEMARGLAGTGGWSPTAGTRRPSRRRPSGCGRVAGTTSRPPRSTSRPPRSTSRTGRRPSTPSRNRATSTSWSTTPATVTGGAWPR
ncbi:hypothetical protein SGPA1_60018 [Streptomyces misionensis JCM 4497]